MNNSEEGKQSLDLSGLDFGPAWAKSKNDKSNSVKYSNKDYKANKAETGKGKRAPQGKKFTKNYKARQNQERQIPKERKQLPEEIQVYIMPIEEGVDNLVKQISSTARTYSIFNLARVVLKSRDRYNVAFKLKEDSKFTLYKSSFDDSAFLTKEESVAHFSRSEKFNEIFTSFEVEVDAPTGNFTSVACCGFSGEPIAPSNYHQYQEVIAQRHEEAFSNMSLEQYKSRIKTEKSEEKVAEWLESMKTQTQFKLSTDDTVVFTNKTKALQYFSSELFDTNFTSVKRLFISSDISFKLISEEFASGLLEVISEQNRYPGELASFLCRQLSGRKLAVYKWQNKLHAGPSRPHLIPTDSPLAERPQKILDWVTKNSGKNIEKLWKELLEEKFSEEKHQPWLVDFKWLLNEGYLVLLEHGQVHLSSDSKLKKAEKK